MRSRSPSTSPAPGLIADHAAEAAAGIDHRVVIDASGIKDRIGAPDRRAVEHARRWPREHARAARTAASWQCPGHTMGVQEPVARCERMASRQRVEHSGPDGGRYAPKRCEVIDPRRLSLNIGKASEQRCSRQWPTRLGSRRSACLVGKDGNVGIDCPRPARFTRYFAAPVLGPGSGMRPLVAASRE